MVAPERSKIIVHRRLQRLFEQHRGKLDAHKGLGPAFAQAVEELEKGLYGDGAEDSSPAPSPSAG